MDTIYSNKKYLQSLNAADYYRANTTLRPAANEYACGSYQNTMSRRSLFGVYSPQPNMSKYSYPSDVSLSSHYGYTSWGLWRDTGHLSPSIYSKKRINIRSFSILIMSAAFIVLLAVLSVAALAFYFSTFKSDSADSTLVFDCLFRMAKGDVYTQGLKSNHTAIYRQKAAFYTKFIETSLEHANFNVAKTEINGFGPGPTDIQLSFRIYLDMRKIQMTITNVEEHIKNAFISETAHSESTFRHLKIDDDSMEIKRQLDPEILRQAAIFWEQTQDFMTTLVPPTTVISLDDLPASSSTSLKKHTTSTEKAKSKLSTTKFSNNARKKDSHKPIHESDIDTENLPVIQGSFEITKTDADIAQKRSDANQRPASTASLTPSTLKPFFISPASSIKIKSGEKQSTMAVQSGSENVLEMFLQHQKQKIKEPSAAVTAKIEKTNKKGEPTVDPTERPKSTESLKSTSVSTSTSTSTPSPPTTTETQINQDLPRLDVNLFTSRPVLDDEPWRPINPSSSQIKPNYPTLTTENSAPIESTTPTSPSFNPDSPENNMYRNKFVDPESLYNDTSDDSVFYQSYYNPDFSTGDLAIEKLGISDVKPYPLPVNKIDLSENLNAANETKDNIHMNYDEDKFEHLGGGVIAKKPEVNESTSGSLNDTLKIIHNEAVENVTSESLSDIFQELLNLDENFNKTDDNKLESRIVPDDEDENDDDSIEDDSSTEKISATTSVERLNFMNMKDFIVQMKKNKSDDEMIFATDSTNMQTTVKPTTTFVEVETLKYTPPAVTAPHTTASEPQLFPGNLSKWEFVNGTQVNATETSMTKKVFNETLKAVIVENSQLPPSAIVNSRFDDLKANRTVDKANLQQLSSIFDTLAAKLGIKQVDVASKMPPFSQNNKLKNNSNRTRTSPTVPSTTPLTTRQRPSTTLTKLSQTKVTTPKPMTTTKLFSTAAFTSSAESMMGQAEVEPVDPTKYDEMLSLLSSSPVTKFTSTTPSLVTLLPVKSNSGIRNFQPRIKLPSRGQAPEEAKNLESVVVKASMSFDS